MSEYSGDSLNAAVLEFRQRFATVMLATVDADGQPRASYAPFLADEAGNVHVFVSQLAVHTGNLLRTPRASLLFIADERDSPNLFARQRLSYSCSAIELARDSDDGATTLDRMEQSFGAIVRTLRGLSDFRLFRFTPEQASYVEGFGAAWRWEGAFPPAGKQPVEPARRG